MLSLFVSRTTTAGNPRSGSEPLDLQDRLRVAVEGHLQSGLDAAALPGALLRRVTSNAHLFRCLRLDPAASPQRSPNKAYQKKLAHETLLEKKVWTHPQSGLESTQVPTSTRGSNS